MIDCERNEPALQLKVNDVLARHVWLRAANDLDHGEVVVEDSLLGVFSLHNEFDLLLKEEDSEWRPVGLDELRRVLAAQNCRDKSKRSPTEPEPAKTTAQRMSNEAASTSPKLLRVGEVTGLDACVQRIEAALYSASIPHCRSALTFVVPSMLHARKVLRSSGLYPHPQYESVLVDSESGLTIGLLEREPLRQ
jgi:hypothetical protein